MKSELDKQYEVQLIVDELRLKIDSNEKEIVEALKNHDNRLFGEIILKLYHKVTSLETSIRLLLDQNDIYTSRIILRSLIEHLITAQYIYCKVRFLKDDDILCEKFFITYRIAENIKRFGFNNKVKRIIDENVERDTVKAYSLDRDEDPVVARKVLEISSQFKLENMVKVLVKSESLKFILKDFNDIFLDALNDYNYLSSSVHGGPSALFWDEEDSHYNRQKIITTANIFVGTMLKIVIWIYEELSKDS